MATNMVSNFLGLGWAATPAGISAMKELKRLQKMSNPVSYTHLDVYKRQDLGIGADWSAKINKLFYR